jgi:hypothetical protein
VRVHDGDAVTHETVEQTTFAAVWQSYQGYSEATLALDSTAPGFGFGGGFEGFLLFADKHLLDLVGGVED